MIHGAKWIEKVDCAAPVTEVAGAIVSERLLVVDDWLGRAAKHPLANAEHVHQLRVATRRAQSALDFFQDSFRAQTVKWFVKQLRRTRRAAGDARNLDVLADRLAMHKHNQQPSLASVQKFAAKQRRKAQKPLVDLRKKLKKNAFKKRSKQLAKQSKWCGVGDEPSFSAAARINLQRLADEFFDAADCELADIETLHRMRILGKKLRYGIELTWKAFDKSLRSELYPAIEIIQESIGVINDRATAKEFLSAWEARSDKSIGDLLPQLVDREDRSAKRKVKEFKKWWTTARLTELRRQFDDAIMSRPWEPEGRSGPQTSKVRKTLV